MSLEDQEIIKEFLIESSENLARLDQEMVELEQRPKDARLLASIFRTIHTIKGTCGFLGFSILESVTHIGESILSQVRDGERETTPELVSLILEMIDAVKKVMTVIEATSAEGGDHYADLRRRLQAACDRKPGTAAEPKPEPAAVAEGAAEAAPGAPAAAEVEAVAAQKGTSAADSTIRVDVMLLDKLMNLVGELVLARNQILQFSSKHEDAPFNATSQRLNLITSELQESVMKTRMQPIGMVWNKLPRVVRDLAASCGKQIQLEMDGAETELDKTIIEAIKDPLTHIVRNSCDHGIETPEVRVKNGKPAQGRLLLRAYHEGGHVNIEMIDDGGGIDPQRIRAKAIEKNLIRPEQAERMSEREILNLIFAPGFSTAAQVSAVSGRGVGMDVVKTNVEKIGGMVDLSSQVGQGTNLKIRIPLTLAIIPGLVVTSAGQRFVIPQVSLLELVRLEGEAGKKLIESIHGTPVYRRRGSLLPLAYLNQVLEVSAQAAAGAGGAVNDVVNIVILQSDDRQFGVVVDGISDTQEIVVKPLGKQLKGLGTYAGVTIMGDGGVALILDVARLGRKARIVTERGQQARSEKTEERRAGKTMETYLLFKAAGFRRGALPLAEVRRLEEFPLASIESAAGRPVIQYRGEILPLISLAQALRHGKRDTAFKKDPLQVVVFKAGERSVGLVVDRILDIVSDAVEPPDPRAPPGVLRSTRIDKKVTDLLDLRALLDACGTELCPDLAQSLEALRSGVSEEWAADTETADVEVAS